MMAPRLELRLRALASLVSPRAASSRRIDYPLVRESVGRAGKSGEETLEAVERSISALLAGSAIGRAKGTDYRVVIPANLRLDDRITSPVTIEASGIRFSLHPATELADALGRDVSKLDVSSNDPKDHHVLFATMHSTHSHFFQSIVCAGDPMSAALFALGAYSVWRSALNFCADIGKFGINFGQVERASLGAPRWAAFGGCGHGEKLFARRLSGLRSEHTRCCDLYPALLARTETLIAESTVDQNDDSVPALLARAISLYGLAMDYAEEHVALLLLWQLAEVLTCIDRRANSLEQVPARLARLCSLADGEILRERELALKGIMELRHGIVHRGEVRAAADSDVSFLSRCCVDALLWLRNNKDSFAKWKDVDAYLRHAIMPSSQLHTIQDAVKRVCEFRSEQKASR